MSPGRLFSRPNLPFIGLTVVATAALVWSLSSGHLAADRAAAPATTGTSALSPAPGDSEGSAPTSSGVTTTTLDTSAAVEAPPTPAEPLLGLSLEPVASGFVQPVFATTAPGDDRIYVLERRGTIRTIDPATGEIAPDFFLNISNLTLADKGIELGLLGLAFHPDYVENGRFFVYYTDYAHDTAVAEYARRDAASADPDSGRIFLRVEREGLRHNAGMLQFGPDGYLWIAIGDGGLFEVYGQDNTQFLGTILRLDVDAPEPYGIPPDNPFVAGGGAPEVWAYGLRNPWRFDIDAATATIYIGDVGQANAEEIDAVPATPQGWNFGWPIMEGPNCWLTPAGCDTEGLTLPVTSYDHASGCSVTGGVVYRGRAIPELFGHYFYSDWCLGWIKTLLLDEGRATRITDWSDAIGTVGQVSSFGRDAAGEVLVVTSEGAVGRIVPER